MASLDPLLQTLIIASPIAVAVMLIALLAIVRRRRKQRSKAPSTVVDRLALQLTDQAQPPTSRIENSSAASVPSVSAMPMTEPTVVAPGVPPAPQLSTESPPVIIRAAARANLAGPSAAALAGTSELDVATLRRKLDHAEASANMIDVAPIYLAIAEAHGQHGDREAQMTALRSAAGIAAKHGPLAAHARARLEMADAAYEAGDLTGACEQWQLARTALLADGQLAEHARVDKIMRDHQCPTDWVLMDF